MSKRSLTIKGKRVVYILLCLGSITISFNVAAMSAVIPAISADLNLPDFVVAKIISYYLIPYGIGALLYAPLTRYFSYRFILAASIGLYALACYAGASIITLDQLQLALIYMGIAAAGNIPLALMIIGDFFDKSIRGRLVGLFFSCSFFASLAGIMLSGIAHWRMLFFVPSVFGAVLALAILVLGRPLLNKTHRGTINYWKVLHNVNVRKIFAFIFIISFCYHGVHKWYGVYLNREYGMNQLSISFFFMLSAMGGLVGQLFGGVVSDLRGRMATCHIGVLGLSISVILLAGHYPQFILGMVLLLISMFWTVGHNGVSTALTDFSDHDRPVIASLNSAVRFFSGGLGFYASSFLVEKSFSLTFLIIGIIILLLNFSVDRVIPVQS